MTNTLHKNSIKDIILSIDNIIVLALSFILFIIIVFYLGGPEKDVTMHAYHIQQINMGNAEYPPTILFYFIVNLLALFSKSLWDIYLATVIVLSFSIWLKYIITKEIIKTYVKDNSQLEDELRHIIKLGAFLLLFLFAIPDYYNAFILKTFYLGRIVPNVWHNSTIIFLMPFALLLFWKQYQILITKDTFASYRDLTILTILIIMNLLIKPSFFFVYLPITIVFLLIRFKFSKYFLFHSIPIIIGVIILIFQYVLIYIYQYGYLQDSENHIVISKPFELWASYIPLQYIPVSILISLILPILYYLFFFTDLKRFKILDIYTIALTLFGLLISILIIEDGPRKFHGNFFWQNVICSYLLSMVIIMKIIKKIKRSEEFNWKIKSLLIVIALQFFSGIFYLGYFISSNSYY